MLRHCVDRKAMDLFRTALVKCSYDLIWQRSAKLGFGNDWKGHGKEKNCKGIESFCEGIALTDDVLE